MSRRRRPIVPSSAILALTRATVVVITAIGIVAVSDGTLVLRSFAAAGTPSFPLRGRLYDNEERTI